MRHFFLAGVLTVGLVTAGASVASVAEAAPNTPIVSDCAWQYQVGPEALNIAYPDTNAVYWATKYSVTAGLQITVHGQFPQARYMSFAVYDGTQGSFESNGVSSFRTDYQIAPDAGSVNPWQTGGAAGGAYTMNLSMSAATGGVNALPLAPDDAVEGQTGYLLYRTYLPSGGVATPGLLPELSVTVDGVTTDVPACTTTAPGQPPVAGTPGGPTEGDLPFARAAAGGANFPNPDSGYLVAPASSPGDDAVIVIRGKAPTWAHGSAPAPWPSADTQVRYWSMCTNIPVSPFPVVVNHLAGGGVDYGCRADDATTLDADGNYTYVLGTEAQRAEIEAVPGVTFLPFAQDQPTVEHAVLLRNMLASPSFAESVLNVPVGSTAAATAAIMGDYYPVGRACAIDSLATDGIAGCGFGG
jgi:hypothetical protein